MVAAPGSKDFGRLSVMLQYRYHLERLFIVPIAPRQEDGPVSYTHLDVYKRQGLRPGWLRLADSSSSNACNGP